MTVVPPTMASSSAGIEATDSGLSTSTSVAEEELLKDSLTFSGDKNGNANAAADSCEDGKQGQEGADEELQVEVPVRQEGHSSENKLEHQAPVNIAAEVAVLNTPPTAPVHDSPGGEVVEEERVQTAPASSLSDVENVEAGASKPKTAAPDVPLTKGSSKSQLPDWLLAAQSGLQKFQRTSATTGNRLESLNRDLERFTQKVETEVGDGNINSSSSVLDNTTRQVGGPKTAQNKLSKNNAGVILEAGIEDDPFIPLEIWHLCFQFLSGADIVRTCSLVCKEWHQAIFGQQEEEREDHKLAGACGAVPATGQHQSCAGGSAGSGMNSYSNSTTFASQLAVGEFWRELFLRDHFERLMSSCGGSDALEEFTFPKQNVFPPCAVLQEEMTQSKQHVRHMRQYQHFHLHPEHIALFAPPVLSMMAQNGVGPGTSSSGGSGAAGAVLSAPSSLQQSQRTHIISLKKNPYQRHFPTNTRREAAFLLANNGATHGLLPSRGSRGEYSDIDQDDTEFRRINVYLSLYRSWRVYYKTLFWYHHNKHHAANANNKKMTQWSQDKQFNPAPKKNAVSLSLALEDVTRSLVWCADFLRTTDACLMDHNLTVERRRHQLLIHAKMAAQEQGQHDVENHATAISAPPGPTTCSTGNHEGAVAVQLVGVALQAPPPTPVFLPAARTATQATSNYNVVAGGTTAQKSTIASTCYSYWDEDHEKTSGPAARATSDDDDWLLCTSWAKADFSLFAAVAAAASEGDRAEKEPGTNHVQHSSINYPLQQEEDVADLVQSRPGGRRGVHLVRQLCSQLSISAAFLFDDLQGALRRTHALGPCDGLLDVETSAACGPDELVEPVEERSNDEQAKHGNSEHSPRCQTFLQSLLALLRDMMLPSAFNQFVPRLCAQQLVCNTSEQAYLLAVTDVIAVLHFRARRGGGEGGAPAGEQICNDGSTVVNNYDNMIGTTAITGPRGREDHPARQGRAPARNSSSCTKFLLPSYKWSLRASSPQSFDSFQMERWRNVAATALLMGFPKDPSLQFLIRVKGKNEEDDSQHINVEADEQLLPFLAARIFTTRLPDIEALCMAHMMMMPTFNPHPVATREEHEEQERETAKAEYLKHQHLEFVKAAYRFSGIVPRSKNRSFLLCGPPTATTSKNASTSTSQSCRGATTSSREQHTTTLASASRHDAKLFPNHFLFGTRFYSDGTVAGHLAAVVPKYPAERFRMIDSELGVLYGEWSDIQQWITVYRTADSFQKWMRIELRADSNFLFGFWQSNCCCCHFVQIPR
ncbi:unnamed protein product [Amoebophrya sp. A120]|nr:unnamed protein product [Amoebophrya sp. A120]|eukprot:GSA120T00007312001.1